MSGDAQHREVFERSLNGNRTVIETARPGALRASGRVLLPDEVMVVEDGVGKVGVGDGMMMGVATGRGD